MWGFTIAFLVISPLLHKGGMKNVVEEFKKKRKGLMVIYVILVVISAIRKLNNALKTGFFVGALICFYKIYKMPSSAGLGESASKAAVLAAAAHKAAKDAKAAAEVKG